MFSVTGNSMINGAGSTTACIISFLCNSLRSNDKILCYEIVKGDIFLLRFQALLNYLHQFAGWKSLFIVSSSSGLSVLR